MIEKKNQLFHDLIKTLDIESFADYFIKYYVLSGKDEEVCNANKKLIYKRAIQYIYKTLLNCTCSTSSYRVCFDKGYIGKNGMTYYEAFLHNMDPDDNYNYELGYDSCEELMGFEIDPYLFDEVLTTEVIIATIIKEIINQVPTDYNINVWNDIDSISQMIGYVLKEEPIKFKQFMQNIKE